MLWKKCRTCPVGLFGRLDVADVTDVRQDDERAAQVTLEAAGGDVDPEVAPSGA